MPDPKRPLHELEIEIGQQIAAIGVTLADLEYRREQGNQMLRLFIDHPGGVDLELCSEVSRVIKDYLDNINPLPYDYLEVSSPGINRKLKKAQDFADHAGQRVKIKTHNAIEGRKNFVGILKGIAEEQVEIEDDGCLITVPLSNISSARLHPDL